MKEGKNKLLLKALLDQKLHFCLLVNRATFAKVDLVSEAMKMFKSPSPLRGKVGHSILKLL